MTKLMELREEKGRLVAQSRAIMDKAGAEKRALTSEERATWDAHYARLDEINDEVSREERQAAMEREVAERVLADKDKDKEKRGGGDTDRDVLNATLAFRNWLQGKQLMAMPEEQRAAIQAMEARALQADSQTAGGYISAPEQFVNSLIKFVDDLVFIRGLATTIRVTNAQSIGAPSLDTDIADSNWTSEIATGSEDSSMAFGKRELHPHPLAKRIKVSNKLLRSAVQNVEDLVMQRMGYKMALTEEKAFLTGTGAQQPLGVFTASNLGISTSRDVSTDNSATAFTADGLINALYSLKSAYQAKAVWIFHRDAVKMARKLKDGNGQYLWQPGLAAGQPDMILSRPFRMSEHAPNTFTTGLYVGIVGDFSYYWIVDALNMQMQRLVELYAETNQTGYIGRAEVDGMPVLEEAFARVKLA